MSRAGQLYRMGREVIEEAEQFRRWLESGGEQRLAAIRAGFTLAGRGRRPGRFEPFGDKNGTTIFVPPAKPTIRPADPPAGLPVAVFYRSTATGAVACRIERTTAG